MLYHLLNILISPVYTRTAVYAHTVSIYICFVVHLWREQRHIRKLKGRSCTRPSGGSNGCHLTDKTVRAHEHSTFTQKSSVPSAKNSSFSLQSKHTMRLTKGMENLRNFSSSLRNMCISRERCGGQAWLCTALVSALGRQRQGDLC